MADVGGCASRGAIVEHEKQSVKNSALNKTFQIHAFSLPKEAFNLASSSLELNVDLHVLLGIKHIHSPQEVRGHRLKQVES